MPDPYLVVVGDIVRDPYVEDQPGDDEDAVAAAAEASDLTEVGKIKFTIHRLSDMSPGSKALWFRLHTLVLFVC